MEAIGVIGIIWGVYRDYSVTLGLYWDNGKYSANYYLGFRV